MKVSTATVPIVLIGLMFVFVWAMGILAVKSSATATAGSLELLRLHIEVARMHDALLARSERSMLRQLGELPRIDGTAVDTASPGREAIEIEAGPMDPPGGGG